MAPKMNPLLLLTAVLAIGSPLLSPASAAAEEKPKKITMPLKDICNLTISENNPNPELCMSTIQSADDDHHDINDMDVATALRLAMKGFFAYAKTAVDHVKQLQDDPKFDQRTKTSLATCHESYTSAIDHMKMVKHEMKFNYGTISFGFSTVVSMVADCQDSFDEMEQKSVIPEYQEKLRQIAHINLVLANFVSQHYS